MRQGLTAYGVGGEVVLPDGIEPAHKELQSSALPTELQKHRSSPRAAWSSSGDTVRRLRRVSESLSALPMVPYYTMKYCNRNAMTV